MEAAVLKVQRLVDRVSRWMRLAPPEARAPRRRFLIIQIDGLSKDVLDAALANGAMRNLRGIIGARRLARRDMSVGLPTSTPAFQASIMYGERPPDIPGFHFYDKRERRELHFPESGVADFVERRIADGRTGILEGGSCYACVFTGGADDSLWTFARLRSLTRAGRGLRRAAVSAVLLGWVAIKCVGLTLVTLVRFAGRAMKALLSGHPELSRSLDALGIDIGLSIWARELFTLLVSADLYRGVPTIYVNFLDYDVTAHAFGPRDRLAFRALRRVDRSIQQLVRVLRRVPEWGYDLYVLSDHGQTPTRWFPRVSRGTSLEDAVSGALGGQRDRVKIIAAGPNAFVYFTDRTDPLSAREIESRHPRALEQLSRHPGIGIVLARGAAGPICWHRGRSVSLSRHPDPGTLDPFARRPDRDLVIEGLYDLMAMPSAGDIVLYGTGVPGGRVSFIDERGAHAGPSEDEMQTFILHPPSVALPSRPLTHPSQLYAHFMAYQDVAHHDESRRAVTPRAVARVVFTR